MANPMHWGPQRTGYFEVVRGANLVQEDAFPVEVDGTTDSGIVELNEGEWATVDATGKACKSDSDADEVCAYPVVTGYERSDVTGSKSVTLAVGSGYWLETSGWDSTNKTADDFPAGTECCIKNGLLYPVASGEFILAIVKRGAKLQQTDGQRALRRDGFTTILVEVGPRGYKPA